MKKKTDQMVVMPPKTVGSSLVFGTVGVFVVVPDVCGKKHETRHTLNNTERPISESIQAF